MIREGMGDRSLGQNQRRAISVMNPAWMQECERLLVEAEELRIEDVITADQIMIVSALATKHKFSISYEKRTFILSRRTTI
jgi:hypothetical protein